MSSKVDIPLKFGAITSISTGIIFFVTALTFFIIPPIQQDFTPRFEFFSSISHDPTLLLFTFWGSLTGSILAIGVVIFLYNYLLPFKKVWIQWSSVLAVIAYALSALQNAAYISQIPKIAHIYLQSPPTIQKAIEAVGFTSLDPDGILQSLMIGIWFCTVSWIALNEKKLSKGLIYLGILSGLILFLNIPALIIGLKELRIIGSALYLIILSPLWFIWLGNFLRSNY